MAKKHDWMDYTNLAANLARANRLREIQQELAKLQQAEANRQRQLEVEDKLRQFIFDWEEKIDLFLEGSVATAPKATLIVARLIDRAFTNAGVEPGSFQQFADKDRVRQVQSKLAGILVNSRQQLTTSEQEEAISCVRFIEEMSFLNEFIVIQEAREQLAITEDTWQQLDAVETKRVGPRRVLGGLLLLFALISCGIGDPLAKVITAVPPRLTIGITMLAGMAIFAVGLIVFLTYKPQETYTKLKAQRQLLQSRIPLPNELNQLLRMFGDRKSSELATMRDERARRIHQAVSYDKHGNVLPAPLITILDW